MDGCTIIVACTYRAVLGNRRESALLRQRTQTSGFTTDGQDKTGAEKNGGTGRDHESRTACGLVRTYGDRAEIRRMEELGVITRVEQRADWCAPTVIVLKSKEWRNWA